MAPDRRVSCAAYEIVPVTAANWRTYRDVRLAALIDAPAAFGTTYAAVAHLGDEAWLGRATNPQVHTWIAMAGEHPLGTVGLWVDDAMEPGVGVLIGMWVALHSRGTGVAKDLVGAVLRRARDLELAAVHLSVYPGMVAAERLYARCGFVQSGRTRPDPDAPDDAARVEREMVADLALMPEWGHDRDQRAPTGRQ